LRSDEVFKKVYYQPLPTLPLNQVSKASSERIAQSEYFKTVDKIDMLFTQVLNNRSPVPLARKDFYDRYNKLSEAITSFEDLSMQKVNTFSVEFLSADAQRMQMDEYVRELNSSWSENLSHDHFLGESVNIMNDLIKSIKTP
jgi:hypothetical protein